MATRIETLSDDDLTRARASVAPLSRDIGSAKRDAGNGALVVAWLGDMHAHSTQDLAESTDTFRTHINSEANFELALTEVLALDPAPDVLVLGGDLTNWNTPAAYDVFRRILDRHWPARGAPPVLPIRGNHDQMLIKPDSLSFHSAWQRLRRPDFPEPADVGDGHYYDVSLGGWRFVAWDPGLNTLTELQRRWIRQRLAPERPSEPTVVLTHVPVLPCGNWVDRFALTDPAVLEALDACPHVKLVMSGHTHKSAAWRYRGKIHAIFPAVAYGIGETAGWGCAVLSRDGVQAVFAKELAAVTFEYVSFTLEQRPGAHWRLETPLYASSPLFDPLRLPRQDDPAERD